MSRNGCTRAEAQRLTKAAPQGRDAVLALVGADATSKVI